MKSTTKFIIIALIITIYVTMQSHPDVSDSTEFDAVVILPDGIPIKIVTDKSESIPEVEVAIKLNYKNLKYNETTPETVQEFLDIFRHVHGTKTHQQICVR